MNNAKLYTGKRIYSLPCLLILILFGGSASSQEKIQLVNANLPRHQIGFCLQAGAVPKVEVTTIMEEIRKFIEKTELCLNNQAFNN
jgi:hypothetical protein